MKMAPIIMSTIETIGAPNTPSPRRARAIAEAPTTVKMMVGWYRSASIAKTPAKNSMLSRFGSLMTERKIDLVPAVWIGASPACSVVRACCVLFAGRTALMTFCWYAEQDVAVPQSYDTPLVTMRAVALLFRLLCFVSVTIYCVNALISFVRGVFSSPVGIPLTIGVADPITVPGGITMNFDDSAMNAWALLGAIRVVKLLLPLYS